ncbi:MAG TPA: CvpA family protein [Caldimonas sp.]
MNLDIGWVDAGLLVALALSVLVGALRGLAFEVLSIAGWFVAYFAAQWAAPFIAPHFPIGTPGSLLNQACAFASVFLVTLIVWSLLSRLVRRLIHATPLSPLDRMFGAAFGLLRGGFVLLVLAAIIAFTPAAKSVAWQQSVGAAGLNAILRGLATLLPPGVAHFLPA